MNQPAGHELVVHSVEDITPGMRRVNFSGDSVRSYMAAGPYIPNIKLYFPVPGQKLDLPRRTEQGILWEGAQRSRVRTYTVRSADPEKATLAVDFVRHGDAGIASSWAEQAAPGSVLGAFGGGGLVAAASDWVLLASDETALPAIASTLERFGDRQRGLALIEISDAGERQELAIPAGFEVRWLERKGAPAGTTTLLTDALAEVRYPAKDWAGGTVRVWVSAESAVVRFARKHLRALGMDRKHHLIIGYWHRGMNESSYASDSDHDRVKGELVVELAGQEFERFSHAH